MSVSEKTDTTIAAILRKLAESYLKQDIVGIAEVLAPGQETVFLGAGKYEKWVGYENIKEKVHETFTEPDPNATWEWTWKKIEQRGRIAWVAAEYVFKTTMEGKVVTIPHRFSAILEKCGNRWLLRQQQHAVPLGGHEE